MDAAPVTELDHRGLRKFGFVVGGIIALLFGLLLPWLFESSLPIWPWLVLGALSVFALVRPMRLRPVHRAWMRFGHIMGRVTTPIIMSILFYLVISPVAVIRALLGKDSMARKIDPITSSYRIHREKSSVENLKRPF